MMRSSSIRILLVLVAIACAEPDRIASPDISRPPLRDARVVTSTSYSATDLGALAGDEESIAWAVNDAGSVAIQSTDLPATGGRVARWYIKTGSVTTMLNQGVIRALSGGPTTFVLGHVTTAVRWTFTPSTGFSSPTELPLINGSIPLTRAVNDLGDATAEVGGDAAIDMLDGTTISIANPNPSVYTFAEARDINNSGDVGLSYLDSYAPTPDRGYLRTADGGMIEFAPLAGHNSTYVRGISERIDGKIYVAGTSDDDNGKYNAVRWTVDIATHSITATEVAALGTYSMAMSNDGTVVGTISGSSTSAFAWKRGGSVTALKTPKGTSSGRVWQVSGDGRFIAGDAMKSNYRRAVLWTAQ